MRASIFYHIRNYAVIAWLGILLVALFLYFFHADFLQGAIRYVAGLPVFWQYAIFLLFGCIRGLTLIPSTYLIVVGLLIFPAWPLFAVVLTGIMISSVSVYYFSEFLRLDEFFERKYQKRMLQSKSIIQKHELPIIIGWSFFPFLPTDLICYVSGTLNINFKKFIFGIFIGEGITCGIYIFGGHYLLRVLQ